MVIAERVLLLGGLLALAFIAGAIRLLRYFHTAQRIHLRLFLAAWFLILPPLFLRIAWISVTFESKDLGQAMGALTLGALCIAGAAIFAGLAIAYFGPTIWSLVQKRRLSSSRGAVPAPAAALMRWPEVLLLALVGLPLLGITWLVLVGNYPALVFHARSDQPLPWLKAVTDPPATIYDGPPNDWAKTSLYTQSSSGRWVRITFSTEAHYRRLATLSPDSVLITWPAAPPLAAAPLSVPLNNLVGAVYRKGSAVPAATVPASYEIAPLASGGFTATTCEAAPSCENTFCRKCASFTVRRFDILGTQTVEATRLVSLDTALCDWWPVHRLMGDDLVYSASHCPAHSNGEGYYRASPDGVQRITSRFHSDQYTAVEDQDEMKSLTQPVTWYRIPWIQDP